MDGWTDGWIDGRMNLYRNRVAGLGGVRLSFSYPRHKLVRKVANRQTTDRTNPLHIFLRRRQVDWLQALGLGKDDFPMGSMPCP
eukprot:5228080-Amphidinium_carterae.3